MKKYIYTTVEVQQMETGSEDRGNHHWSTAEEELVKAANKLGASGWQLAIAIPRGHYGYRLIFERREE